MRTVIVLRPENPFVDWYATKFDSLAKAKAFKALVEQELPDVVTIIPTKHPEKYPDPKQADRPSGTLWCPYCRAYRKFRSPLPKWYPRCIVCHIDDEDFWVKNVNDIWPADDDSAAIIRRRYAEEEVEPEIAEKRERRRERARNRKIRKEREGKKR